MFFWLLTEQPHSVRNRVDPFFGFFPMGIAWNWGWPLEETIFLRTTKRVFQVKRNQYSQSFQSAGFGHDEVREERACHKMGSALNYQFFKGSSKACIVFYRDIQFRKSEYLIRMSPPQAKKWYRPRFPIEGAWHFETLRDTYLRCNLPDQDMKSGLRSILTYVLPTEILSLPGFIPTVIFQLWYISLHFSNVSMRQVA